MRAVNHIDQLIKSRNILITGGTGSIGSALVKAVLRFEPAVVRIYSRDDTKQYNLSLRLNNSPNVHYLIGDIKDTRRLGTALKDIDIVFHTAALKHVPACESNPFEAVQNNIIGTQNIIEQCIINHVKLVVGISTDKVVNSTSVLGTTKLLAEKLLLTANTVHGSHTTVFSCVRFGNVAGARGSFIPVFLDQIRRGEPLTVTDPEMTRFIMSTYEAINLILKATALSTGGEIFIFRMPAVRIMDVAEALTERYQQISGKLLPIKITGLRSGEKLFEELIFPNEFQRVLQYENLLIIPSENSRFPIPGIPISQLTEQPILSSKDKPLLGKTEILDLVKSLDTYNLLQWDD